MSVSLFSKQVPDTLASIFFLPNQALYWQMPFHLMLQISLLNDRCHYLGAG